MQLYLPLMALLFATTISSCQKKDTAKEECFADTATVRQITNAQATVKAAGGKFYVVEQGAIDTKLNPCTLAQEFQVHNLPVIISGDVKSTTYNTGDPCCTENFVITAISR